MAAGVPLEKVTAPTAAELCKKFPLSDEGRKLLTDGQSPADFYGRLLESKLYTDAIRLLAHGLPKQEAVWWACQCARAAHGPSPSKTILDAIAAAEKWVADPSEEHRRAAMPAAEAAQFETPAGCAAVAAFWSGGSLAPPNAPVVPPADYLTGHGAASAVIMAGIIREPHKAPDKYRAFLSQGQEIANGKNRWKEVVGAPGTKQPEPPVTTESNLGSSSTGSRIQRKRW